MNLEEDLLHKPVDCPECGGTMVFEGLGEYSCEKCKHKEFDDYGKVRSYLEKNPGSTAYEIAQHTGLRQRNIRKLIQDERIEISENSKVFLKCEMCGADIRSGRYCPQCLVKHEAFIREEERRNRKSNISGFGMNKNSDDGKKRYSRDK